MARILLGELLVEAQIITREQLEEALELQKKDGRRLGTLLVEAGFVTETQVTQILSQQLSVPWVSLYHIDFSRQLLNLVPRELAEQHCLVPIFVRRVRGQGETLYIAMDNPDDEAALQEVATYSGLPIRSMIAPPSDIRAAIRAYYGGGELGPPPETTRISAPPAEPAQAAEPARKRSDTLPEAGALEAASAESQPSPAPAAPMAEMPRVPSVRPNLETAPPDSGPQISARDVNLPPPKRGAAQRMITVTLLDGTQVNLPARRSRRDESAEHEHGELTARDLVAALRAVSHGADASEVLGEKVSWEKLFAALLSVLLKKHLIADWEFVDEYKKV